MTVETDVLIVGAGPVGLFLANDCARRGLRWRLIETREGQSLHSKALAIFPRTLEILDMAGLIDPFLEAANRVTSVAILSHEHPLARMRFAPAESPYPFIAMVPQNVTERLLHEQLERRGGTVDYESTLVSAVAHEDYISATIDRQGTPITIRASYLVGCDGAHSRVRHLLNIPFAGKQYDASFMLADVETNEALPADELQLCPNESGPLAIFPMSPRRRRIVATVKGADGGAPSLDLVQTLLAQRAPAGIRATVLHWSSYFRVHHRQAAQLRVGRAFIAGDAAHIHSPFGGQGMNTGLHDAWNLVWKLALAIRGRAGEGLLDSYSTERRPVIRGVIRTTDLLTKVMGTPSNLAQSLRDTLIPALSQLAPFQHAFVKRLSGLGIAYPHSPIIEGGGARFFDASVRGGDGIGSRFLLFIGREDAAGGNALRLFADSFNDLVEWRETLAGKTVLVRPDGYTAYSAPARHGETAAKAMWAVLQRQTRQAPVTQAQAESSFG